MEGQDEPSGVSQSESVESFEEEYWKLAFNGVLLVINNEWKGAEELFDKYK